MTLAMLQDGHGDGQHVATEAAEEDRTIPETEEGRRGGTARHPAVSSEEIPPHRVRHGQPKR